MQGCEISPQDCPHGRASFHLAHPDLYGFRSQRRLPCRIQYLQIIKLTSGYLEEQGQRNEISAEDRIHPGDRITIAYDPAAPSRVRCAGDVTRTYAAGLLMLRVEACLGAGAIAHDFNIETHSAKPLRAPLRQNSRRRLH